jgi:hypothetical protein
MARRVASASRSTSLRMKPNSTSVEPTPSRLTRIRLCELIAADLGGCATPHKPPSFARERSIQRRDEG